MHLRCVAPDFLAVAVPSPEKQGLSEGGQFLPAVESHVRQAEFSGFTQMGQIRSRALKGIVASSLFACVEGWVCNRLRVRSAIMKEWVWCRIKL